eukprot:TRINITY_DN3221_c0_g1_i1.p1 TRINITY_DN3221_c0_g1~~TRINITY_DN3221_c0_g1_i1.p1  ORF type:complete len:317 (-),score=64.16 TRINITY_DN3221_c0_g1_i1:27-977(-)
MNFIDIGANLCDECFQTDLEDVLARASSNGVRGVVVTSGCTSEAQAALAIARSASPTSLKTPESASESTDSSSSSSSSSSSMRIFTTVGVHPTRAKEAADAGEEQYLNQLSEIISNNRKFVAAIGECGLDFDRTHFCPAEIQKKYFPLHFTLSEKFDLPLFLHLRNAFTDFREIIHEHRDIISRGAVVHSFDGSLDELKQLLHMGFYIGINGCSLKSEENLSVASQIPLERLMLETDAPFCGIRPSHAGYKYLSRCAIDEYGESKKLTKGKLLKSRNEPCCIVKVAQVVAAVMHKDINSVAEAAFVNAEKMFFSKL